MDHDLDDVAFFILPSMRQLRLTRFANVEENLSAVECYRLLPGGDAPDDQNFMLRSTAILASLSIRKRLSVTVAISEPNLTLRRLDNLLVADITDRSSSISETV